MHSYLESGWCYSEYVTSLLGHRLDEFSSEVLGLLEATELHESLRQRQWAYLTDALENKRFRNPTDKLAVKGIIRAFLHKHTLFHAIAENNVDVVCQLLHKLGHPSTSGQIRKLGGTAMLKTMLDQPVNEGLDTLMHFAVRGGSPA